MTLNPGPHLLEPCLGKPDFRVVILTAQFDPSIEDKPAQHHFPCPDWKAVGQPPVGQAEVLQDRSLAHIGAWICGSHFLAFSPNSAIRSKLIACSRYSPSIFMALSRSNFFVARAKESPGESRIRVRGTAIRGFQTSCARRIGTRTYAPSYRASGPSFFWPKRIAHRIGICALPLSLDLQIYCR